MVTLIRLTTTLTLSLSLLLGLSACSGAQEKPTATDDVDVKLRRVDLDLAKASFDAVDLVIVALVENGSGGDVEVSGGEAQLKLAGPPESLGGVDEDDEGDDEDESDEGESDEGGVDTSGIVTGQWVRGRASSQVVAPARPTEVPIRVTLKLPEDPDALERLTSWGRMTVEVKGELTVNGQALTFGGLREVATPTLPTPVLQEAQVASLDQGERGVAFFRVGIDNPNVFDIRVDSFAWGVTVGGKELKPMPEGAWENVPASSVASFEDSLNLDVESYGPEVKKLLRQPSVPYVVEGRMVVKGIEKPFRFEGEMEFAR